MFDFALDEVETIRTLLRALLRPSPGVTDLVSAKLPSLRTFCDLPPAPITLGAQEAAPASALALPMICDPRGRQATSSATRRSQYLAGA